MTDDEICAMKSDQIAPMLRGLGPAIQGAIIADLTAIWLAGHHPALRAIMKTSVEEIIAQLVPINEAIIFGSGGWKAPDTRKTPAPDGGN